MALTNYEELQTAVLDWLNRQKHTATIDRVPDFIALAEAKIFRRIRTYHTLVKTEYPAGGTNPEGIAVPENYREARLLTYDGVQLSRQSAQWLFSQEPLQPTQRPKYFIRTTQDLIEFWPPPDEDAEVVLYHYADDPISDANVPRLFLEHPDLWLFGALMEAGPFLMADDGGAMWAAKFEDAMANVEEEADVEEDAGSTNQVEAVYSEGVY